MHLYIYLYYINDFNYFWKEMIRKDRGKNLTRLQVLNRTHKRVGSYPKNLSTPHRLRWPQR